MLAIEGVNQYYGESHTLRDVALEVKAGSCTVVMGRNGVGKTTLLGAIMGLRKIGSGSVRFEGEDLVGKPPERRAHAGIGFVPQGREIFPQLSVEENLRLGLTARKDRTKDIPSDVYELFPVLKTMLRRRGGDLSGGQQQQLAIARALVLGPKLLILDEPTEGIQPNVVHEIGDVLIRLNKERGLTILLVEQKLPFARRLADAFVVMEKGAAVASGAMSALGTDVIRRHLSV